VTELHNQVRRRRRSAEGGFTLIELLVVIAILSVLATIVIINVVGVKSSANTAACNTNAQEVQTALTEYYNVADTYPFGAGTITTQGQLSSLSPYLSSTDIVGAGTACQNFIITVAGDGSLNVKGTATT
jgi:prepilin-type N-terminal cleavage/methylation domain-containing protein